MSEAEIHVLRARLQGGVENKARRGELKMRYTPTCPSSCRPWSRPRPTWHPGLLVCLESTTYPGTTEEVVQPILEATGLKAGRDFFLAFSPERVDPSNSRFKTENTPKVVGGVTVDCTEVAAELYRHAIPEVHSVSSARAAEMVNLLENTFRLINIGLVNEIALVCERLGLDVWEIIDAAATKPFGYMPFYPGPGIGGHCILIDLYYLAWKAREYKTAVYFAADGAATNLPKEVVVGSGRDWGLDTRVKEELLGVTLVAPQLSALAGSRYALVTTTQGRVLAKRFLTNATSTEAVFTAYTRGVAACPSPTGTPKFALRTSATSDVVYLTDRACREALALQPKADGASFVLDFAQERRVTGVDADGEVIFSAYSNVPPLSTGAYAPEGLTPAVGLGFSLAGCTGDTQDEACEPVEGFKLWSIPDSITDAGVTLFKVETPGLSLQPRGVPGCPGLAGSS